MGKCSETLGLSESLAAVTLMALANGAGDVITALVSGSGAGGVSYNIGALYGAGLFVAVCVVSISIFTEKDGLVFDKMIIYRDIGAYLIATILTIFFCTNWVCLLVDGCYFPNGLCWVCDVCCFLGESSPKNRG